VARREGNFVREYPTRENVAPKIRKGRAIGSRNQDFKKQLRLESKRTTRNQQEYDLAGYQKTTCRDFQRVASNQELEIMERSAPLQNGKRSSVSVGRAGDVRSPATPCVMAPH
jgi:hypothetical protein